MSWLPREVAGPLACPRWVLVHPAGLVSSSTDLPSLPMQLSLRLKAMKRQVEEAEEEIDRLESSKKKLQRELEEQMDVNEQLQGQLNNLKKNIRWASAETPQGHLKRAPCF